MTRRLLLPAVLLALTSACDDDPFRVRWEASPREAVLYALDRGELNEPSAFDMLAEFSRAIESPGLDGSWDFAVDRESGQMVLLPPTVLGVSSEAGIAAIPGVAFDDVLRAPTDSLAYVADEPVPLELGTIYVVRTRLQRGTFGRLCFYYGKMEPLEIDLESGVLRFLHDTSPDCNNRSLIPPD